MSLRLVGVDFEEFPPNVHGLSVFTARREKTPHPISRLDEHWAEADRSFEADDRLVGIVLGGERRSEPVISDRSLWIEQHGLGVCGEGFESPVLGEFAATPGDKRMRIHSRRDLGQRLARIGPGSDRVILVDKSTDRPTVAGFAVAVGGARADGCGSRGGIRAGALGCDAVRRTEYQEECGENAQSGNSEEHRSGRSRIPLHCLSLREESPEK